MAFHRCSLEEGKQALLSGGTGTEVVIHQTNAYITDCGPQNSLQHTEDLCPVGCF